MCVQIELKPSRKNTFWTEAHLVHVREYENRMWFALDMVYNKKIQSFSPKHQFVSFPETTVCRKSRSKRKHPIIKIHSRRKRTNEQKNIIHAASDVRVETESIRSGVLLTRGRQSCSTLAGSTEAGSVIREVRREKSGQRKAGWPTPRASPERPRDSFSFLRKWKNK